MKLCPRCGALKPLDAFQGAKKSADGLQWKCRDCMREIKREWAHTNPEKRRAASRRHYQLEKARVGRRPSKDSSAVKHRVHASVANAIKSGRLFRPPNCSSCGATERRIHAHHEDYSNRLSVRWLCTVCHALAHQGAAE